MKVTQSTPSSTDTLPVRIPGASGHQPHIPTARTAAGSYSRKTLTAAIEADASENDRWLPGIPGQRRSPEQPAPKVPGQRQGAYDDIVLRYGETFAHGAF